MKAMFNTRKLTLQGQNKGAQARHLRRVYVNRHLTLFPTERKKAATIAILKLSEAWYDRVVKHFQAQYTATGLAASDWYAERDNIRKLYADNNPGISRDSAERVAKEIHNFYFNSKLSGLFAAPSFGRPAYFPISEFSLTCKDDEKKRWFVHFADMSIPVAIGADVVSQMASGRLVLREMTIKLKKITEAKRARFCKVHSWFGDAAHRATYGDTLLTAELHFEDTWKRRRVTQAAGEGIPKDVAAVRTSEDVQPPASAEWTYDDEGLPVAGPVHAYTDPSRALPEGKAKVEAKEALAIQQSRAPGNVRKRVFDQADQWLVGNTPVGKQKRLSVQTEALDSYRSALAASTRDPMAFAATCLRRAYAPVLLSKLPASPPLSKPPKL